MRVRRAPLLYLLYPLWVHWVVSQGQARYALLGLAILVLVVEPLRAGGLPRRPLPRGAMVASVTLACLDLLIASPLALYLPPIAGPLAAACWFAASLRPGRTPVIVRIARAVTGDHGQRRTDYARRLTAVWALVCAVLATESLVLALLATPPVWSLMAHLVNNLIILAVFVLEMGVRWCYLGPPRAPLRMLRHVLTIDWQRALVDPARLADNSVR